MENWRTELRSWAEACAKQYQKRPKVIGTIIGGSLARGQEWQHSDLELGLLVEERDAEIPYFNVNAGRGLEAIQLVQDELADQVRQVEGGNWNAILQWPIQLWRGRIVHDPTGTLKRFKQQFDEGLFQEPVLREKIRLQQVKVGEALAAAGDLMAVGRPAAALVRARGAMNELILAFHWAHGELPRSQSRTDSRLRRVSQKHGAPDFYRLYREVFDLEDCNRVIRATWPKVRGQVLEITRLWGDSARDFFEFAVDGNFEWRQNAGILTVYRLYIPVIGGEAHSLTGKVDDPVWRTANPGLIAFLGLEDEQIEQVGSFVKRIEDATARIG